MELIETLEPVTAIILLGMVAGVVELIKRIFEADWRACAIIIGAGATGALVAIPLGISALIGAVIGLSSTGYVTIAQNFGKEAI